MTTGRPARRPPAARRQDKGRRTSRVKTPALVRAYLMGEDFSSDYATGRPDRPDDPDGPDEQAATRFAQGDYVSRMHKRIKWRIRQMDAERKKEKPYGWRPYQYPRHHSFQSFLNNLVLLGLVEKTSRREPGVRATVPGFEERHWYRLTQGSADRPEWLDPMLYIALRFYPGIRKGIVPGMTPPRRRPPSRVTRTGEPKRRVMLTPPGPGQDQLTALQTRQQRLAQQAQLLQDSSQPRVVQLPMFQRLLADGRAFLRDLDAFDPQHPLIDLADALNTLEACGAALADQRAMTTERATALRSCQNAARLVGEALEPTLKMPKARRAAPARRGRRRGVTVQTQVAPAPTRTVIPNFTLAVAPTKAGVGKLQAQLERLKDLNGGSGLVDEDGDPLIRAELDRLAEALDEWKTVVDDMVDKENDRDNPNDTRLDALGDRLTAIEATVADLETYDIAAAQVDLEGAPPQ